MPDPLDIKASPSPSDVIAPDKLVQPVLAKPKRQLPSTRRNFGDAQAISKLIYDNVLTQASKIEPVKNSRYQLSLNDLHYADPDTFPIQLQKEYILGNKDLYRRLRGTWRLHDVNTGNLVDEKKMTIAQVPHMTQRGTFILKGTEYTLGHQIRLRPGIFTRIKANNEVEAHVNVIPGKGVSHRYFFEPATGVFRINVGQSKVPLMPVLRALGVTERQMKDAWGPEILALNQKHDAPHVIDKLYERMVRKPDLSAPRESKAAALSNEIQKMELDPEVTKRTLGVPYKNLTPQAILDTTKKLIAVNKHEQDADDRDHLAFQTLMGPEDLVAERIGKDRATLNKLIWNATFRGNLEHIQPGAFNKSVKDAFMKSGLGQAAEEVNAAELIDQQGRISKLGEGGIGDAQSVPIESRGVHPSQMGYIDSVKTPESICAHPEFPQYFMTKQGWKSLPEISDQDEFACMIDDRLEYHKPIKMHIADYDGPMHIAQTRCMGYAVTPNHRMWVKKFSLPKSEWHFELAADMHDKYMKFQIGGHAPYTGIYKSHFELPGYDGKRAKLPTIQIPMDAWCELMGWYLSEGSLSHTNRDRNGAPYVVNISQYKRINPDNFDQIEALLKRLSFNYHIDIRKDKGAVGLDIYDRRLSSYLSTLGDYCYDKFIPEDLQHVQPEARQRLYDALLLGDGRRDRRGRIYALCTTSTKLAEGFQRLAFGLGQSSTISIEPEKRKKVDGSDNLPTLIVQLHKETTRTIENNARAAQFKQPRRYEIEHFKGKCYCVTLPGGMIYTKLMNKGGFWSGNSFKTGVDLRTAYGVQKGTTDGRIYAPFYDAKRPGNRIVYRSPQELADLTVAFPGELESGKKMIHAMSKGKLSLVPVNKVDLVLPSMENSFSPLSNMVPMKSTVKGQRVSMGARMISQALPLQNAEAPLVQSAMPTSHPGSEPLSFEQLYGQQMGIGHLTAKQSGIVTGVKDDRIDVKYDDGTKDHYDLYNSFPYNRKTYLHNTPLVDVGSRFQQHSLLGKSNYTDDQGTAALGINARVGYLPFQGKNYEDAAVISESMAKRLTSEHMYQVSPTYSENTHRGKNAYISLFAGKYDRKTLDTMDEHGVVKPGTVVQYGQPLVLLATEKERAHNQVHRSGKSAFTDNTEVWGHASPGIVTDVAHSRNGVLVAVKTYVPMQIGDKLCYSSDTEVLTKDGWKFIETVKPDDLVASLNPDTEQIEYVAVAAKHVYPHTGRMYQLDTTQVSLLVTDNHKLYAKPRSVKKDNRFKLLEAQHLFGKRYRLKKNGNWEGSSPESVCISGYTDLRGLHHDDIHMPVDKYLMLLGAFLSEGNLFSHVKSGSYGIDITQVKEPNRSLLRTTLQNHDIKFCENGEKFRIYGKQLYLHMKQFGQRAGNKFIQPEIFDWSKEHLTILFNWLMFGDGHKGATHWSYTTISKRLAGDVQRLALHIGLSGNITTGEWYECIIKGKKYSCAARHVVSLYRHKNEPEINHGHSKRQNGQREDWVDYNGQVHCVTLTSNHVMYVRRNGKACWNGNSGRYGDKGIVSEITPDEKMPHGADGKPLEILVSPLGLISRINSAQIIEAALGKIAAKTGQPYKVQDFTHPNLTQYALDELKKHGMNDTETVVDPATGRKIPNVLVGNRFFMKLQHTSESKIQGRGAGGGYTSSGEPAKGGESGSKRVSLADNVALLAHGALGVMHDARVVRGQRNEDYWLQFMAGYTPTDPKVPFVYEKFLNELKSAGINVVRQGPKLHIMALTNKDIDHLAGARELKNAETVDWKEGLLPKKGGLFDPGLTGSHGGNLWSRIKLHEPMPNPAMEEPIRRLLNVTENEFLSILSGKKPLNGMTGPDAIHTALKNINIPKEIERSNAEIKSGKKSYRDGAIRRLQYLEAAKKLNIHPQDWVLNSVPVLPPAFRPVSLMQGNKGQVIADPNYLYREVWDANQNLKELKGQIDDVSEERLNVYNAFKGITGLGDPIQPKNIEKKVKGVLRYIFGTSPKLSTVQFKLLGSSVNLVGRGVVAPDPDMDMDHVGIPEHKAWDVYKPFIIRGLVRRGMPRIQALKAVEDQTPSARDELQKAIVDRPVIMNRYPILHRYGLMAFWPKLVKGDTIRVSPVVTKGFGMDFDGDTSQFHVVASEQAKQDAIEKMLPSANLFSAATFRAMYVPNQEFVQGLHAASAQKNEDQPKRTFADRKSALTAYRRGEIDLGTPIEIINHR